MSSKLGKMNALQWVELRYRSCILIAVCASAVGISAVIAFDRVLQDIENVSVFTFVVLVAAALFASTLAMIALFEAMICLPLMRKQCSLDLKTATQAIDVSIRFRLYLRSSFGIDTSRARRGLKLYIGQVENDGVTPAQAYQIMINRVHAMPGPMHGLRGRSR